MKILFLRGTPAVRRTAILRGYILTCGLCASGAYKNVKIAGVSREKEYVRFFQ